MPHTIVTTCCWLSSYCLSRVRSPVSSLSSSKTVQRACETISLVKRQTPLSFRQTCAPAPTVKIWTRLTTEFGENEAAALPDKRSSRWTDARSFDKVISYSVVGSETEIPSPTASSWLTDWLTNFGHPETTCMSSAFYSFWSEIYQSNNV